ncbi:histone-lysine N-methyltransferase, H3 lysine-79 specific isoform X4 [Hermetia illucens]|uniref:histone-lysine N-methyltransferase, H3 lysine-79 specific isoform X4 n=1 Tax=Hermetia illucens TaxID=343691 RepID=UPI0018CC3403|nr:histone-lysine N-methyltransferase, H3 lysine-79 specific isoform X4 [Hermetia illucens]
MLSENMASLGGEQIISTKDLQDSTPQKTTNSRPSSVERKLASRDRDEKLRLIKERQNEERQRKIEELKAQAEAAQKYREQKEEERKRKIEELRNRETDRRLQVEERKKAIMEAERERREYIVRRNQERDAKLDNKRRNERSSVYAFGSSTPRLLDPAELGTLSQSTYWGHRRSTSITNVAYTGAPLSRRSSERELADGSKKRATSAGGIDRQNEDRRFKSTSMYEVFNWGYLNDEPPKRLNLSFAATEINIDGPTKYTNIRNNTKEDITDSPPISYRSVARRKTDLMPTIPSPRESSFGSKTSLHSHTPRTPGRAVSMTRLDQLAQPIRRNGEHIRAVIERERQQQYGLISNTSPNTLTQTSPTTVTAPKSMSRSMTHLAGTKQVYSNKHINDNSHMIGGQHCMMRPLKKNDTSRSMTQLTSANRIITTTTTTKKITAARSARYERKDDAPSSLASTGSRSGDVTPGGSINTSRPGSAMSTSTTASGLVQRRSVGTVRKPRPASIAVTGVSLNDEINKHKKEKPPLPKTHSTPKRINNNSNAMSKSMTVETPKTNEKRSSAKKDTPTPKPRALLQQLTDNVTEKTTTDSVTSVTESETTVETKTIEKEPTADIPQTKEEKEALNAVKTEANAAGDVVEVTKEIVTEIKTETQVPSEMTPTEEKVDTDTEKDKEKEKEPSPPKSGSETRELSAERQDNEMTASMIARKITTEEQAKAALAEKRRIMREEAERQAELERQRLEAERQAELQRQAEEEERQRKFEEETLRLAEEQKKAEEQRLLQAIEEAKKREEAERLKREEEEKQRIEREEAEKKAKEEAEKQRLEIAERLKKEEKEREERRKRVEAIMSRTRAKGGNNTPNSTPTKENDNKTNGNEKEENVEKTNEQSTVNKETDPNAQPAITVPQQEPQQPAEIQMTQAEPQPTLQSEPQVEQQPAQPPQVAPQQQETQPEQQQPQEVQQQPQEVQPQPQEVQQQPQEVQQQPQQVQQPEPQMQQKQPEPFSEQCAYEKTVTDRENALIKSFSNMIIDDSNKVFQNFQNPFIAPPSQMTNGKTLQEQNLSNETVVQPSPVANGNGHIENINKNDTNQLVDFSTDQLIDFNNESQQMTGNVNFNNNSLSTTTGPNLVTSDSHENKEISLL